MAAALELRVQEGVHNPLGHHVAHHQAAHGQAVGVVVATSHLGGIGLAAQGTANSLHLVGGDRDANAGGADQHRPIHFAIGQQLGGGIGEVGVVTAVQAVGAHIDDNVALVGQVLSDMLLQGEAAVIGCHGNFHLSQSSSVVI